MSVPPSTQRDEETVRTAPLSDDEALLAELGYKQELHRGMSGFSNFAVSFSIISILAAASRRTTWRWTPADPSPSRSAGPSSVSSSSAWPYIAYVVPVFLRRTHPEFRQGRWNLGRWSAPIGWIAVAWVSFIVVLFMLPAYAPGTWGDDTFNYAPVAVAVVIAFSTVTWFIGGRKHFMRDVPEGHDTKPAEQILG